MPEMSDQIQSGMANLDINNRSSTMSTNTTTSLDPQSNFDWAFPNVTNPLPNVPPSDDEIEARLENARMPVLTSNDPNMQLEWAGDALIYIGTCVDNEERLQATQPPRPGTPHIERQIKMDAMNVVGFLADQHHPQAEFMRGTWFEFGRFGVAQDKREAFRCYSRAADRGYARAEYRIGMLYEASNDSMKALKHYNRGADQADSASLYRLGMMTLRGQHGQRQDYMRGVDLIRRSADCADENAPQGAYIYGMLLARQLPQIQIPDGVLPMDEPLAKTYVEKAAYLKFAKAQLKMGSAYELAALGCPFDPVLSLHYNRLASKQGEPEADMAISKWFLVGSEPLFPKNEEIAYNFANRAAATGLSNAEFAMGYYNELGVFVPKNLDLALEWYKRAANNGNPDAAGRIDGISRKQFLSRKDHENVAIKRIQSQYGSQRKERPSRFKQGHPPRGSSLSGQAIMESPTPPRSASVAPYPEDDRPPTVQPLPARSTSVAPYPVDDRPSSYGPPLHGGFLNVDPPRPATVQPDRPSTAFIINPALRPSSTATTGSGHQAPPQRMKPQPPRPGSVPNPQGRPSQGRVASNPAGLPSRVPSTAPTPTPPPHVQNTPIDIGFSAPPDERENRRRMLPSQQGRSTSTVNGTLGPRNPPLHHSSSTSNLGNPPPRSSSTLNQTASHPPPNSMSPSSSYSATPPPPSSFSSRPPSAPASQPSIDFAPQQPPNPPPHTSAAAKPIKKGPQTFDEMGVPQIKDRSDCVSLLPGQRRLRILILCRLSCRAVFQNLHSKVALFCSTLLATPGSFRLFQTLVFGFAQRLAFGIMDR